MKRLLVIGLICALSPAAVAQLYKYVDKDGKTVYTDQPPPTVDPKTVNVQSSPTPGSVPAKNALEREKDLEKTRAKGKDEAKKSDQTAKEAAAREERCNSATDRYRSLAEGGRIYKYDDKGERVYMDEQEMAGERDKTRRIMDEACKKS